MIKQELGSRVDTIVKYLFPFMFWRPINPNLLTILGTLISLGAGVALARGEFLIAGFVLLAGGFFDLVDGVVARHFGLSTTFGGFLDSSLDRLVDIALMLGLVIHYSAVGESTLVALSSVILASTILTSYTKARAENIIDHLPGGLFERGERFGVLAAAAILGLMPLGLWILAIGTTVTAAKRLWDAYRAMTLLDAADAGVPAPATVDSSPADLADPR